MEAETFALEDVTGEFRIVQFQLNDEYYAVDVSKVSSIVEMKPVTRVPRASEAIDGVVDLRGEITAIINPWVLFDIEGTAVPESEQLVLVFREESDGQQIGLRVDDVLGVNPVADSNVEYESDVQEFDSEGFEQELIRGVIHDPADDGVDLIALVDVDAVVDAAGPTDIEMDPGE